MYMYLYNFIFSGIRPIWKFYTNLTCKADGRDIYTDCTFQEGTCNRVTHNYASVQCFKSGTSPGVEIFINLFLSLKCLNFINGIISTFNLSNCPLSFLGISRSVGRAWSACMVVQAGLALYWLQTLITFHSSSDSTNLTRSKID